MMEFIGDEEQAAPKVAQAGWIAASWHRPGSSCSRTFARLTRAGLVHADLSVYNLLWWRGRLIVIDLPQAVEFTTNADAYDLLHRDVANVGEWFARHGLRLDAEAVYAELLTLA